MMDTNSAGSYPSIPYIADFACLELKLIIELDGGQHADQINYDNQRKLFLDKSGFKVIRFWNNEVIENICRCIRVHPHGYFRN